MAGRRQAYYMHNYPEQPGDGSGPAATIGLPPPVAANSPDLQHAARPRAYFVRNVPIATVPWWIVGRGTVVYKVWLAVLGHSIFATVVVVLTEFTPVNLGVPNILITAVGFLIGFTISYRVSSAYDRYWSGRGYWSDIIRDTRGFARLIWFHIPPKLKSDKDPSEEDEANVIAEKKALMGLVEGLSVAIKHHLRGETGIYYEDLYHLVSVMPQFSDNDGTHTETNQKRASEDISGPEVRSTLRGRRRTYQPIDQDDKGKKRRSPFLQPANPGPADGRPSFRHFLWSIFRYFGFAGKKQAHDAASVQSEDGKFVSLLPTGADNLPVRIIVCLSEYLHTLDARKTIGGTVVGMYINLATLESSFTNLEKILTTPLPFIYAVHLRHVVWLYLFFLPFQLTPTFRYVTIPGVAIAAFFFLGFLAAAEEIEQPFGYDENDIDLDTLCRIIHEDLKDMMSRPVPFSSSRGGLQVVDGRWVVLDSSRSKAESSEESKPNDSDGKDAELDETNPGPKEESPIAASDKTETSTGGPSNVGLKDVLV